MRKFKPQAEIVRFASEDVIATSFGDTTPGTDPQPSPYSPITFGGVEKNVMLTDLTASANGNTYPVYVDEQGNYWYQSLKGKYKNQWAPYAYSGN